MLELRRHVRSKIVLEAVRQLAPPPLLDVAQVVGHPRAGEPPQRLLESEPGAEPGRELDDALDRDPLAVHEHAVAVEQHRVDAPLPPRSFPCSFPLRSATPPPLELSIRPIPVIPAAATARSRVQ